MFTKVCFSTCFFSFQSLPKFTRTETNKKSIFQFLRFLVFEIRGAIFHVNITPSEGGGLHIFTWDRALWWFLFSFDIIDINFSIDIEFNKNSLKP